MFISLHGWLHFISPFVSRITSSGIFRGKAQQLKMIINVQVQMQWSVISLNHCNLCGSEGKCFVPEL